MSCTAARSSSRVRQTACLRSRGTRTRRTFSARCRGRMASGLRRAELRRPWPANRNRKEVDEQMSMMDLKHSDVSLRTLYFDVQPPRVVRIDGSEWRHEVRIALPVSYTSTQKLYPVLWLTDN